MLPEEIMYVCVFPYGKNNTKNDIWKDIKSYKNKIPKLERHRINKWENTYQKSLCHMLCADLLSLLKWNHFKHYQITLEADHWFKRLIVFHILLAPNIITNLSSNTKILFLRQKFGNSYLAYGMLREHIFLAAKEKVVWRGNGDMNYADQCLWSWKAKMMIWAFKICRCVDQKAKTI